MLIIRLVDGVKLRSGGQLNPNGIATLSPGLRRRSYLGLRRKILQPQRGCGVFFAPNSETTQCCWCISSLNPQSGSTKREIQVKAFRKRERTINRQSYENS